MHMSMLPKCLPSYYHNLPVFYITWADIHGDALGMQSHMAGADVPSHHNIEHRFDQQPDLRCQP